MAYLDEFGTIGHIPEFANRMATVRSAGIGCLLVVQDQAQLTKAYGEEDADTILSNATTKMCLARVTRDDAEYFSALAGTTTVHSANQSASRPLLLPWADRGNRGLGEAQRALITPDELRTMRGEIFLVAGDHNPIRARQRRYYDDPALARCVPNRTGPDPLIVLMRAAPLPVPILASHAACETRREPSLATRHALPAMEVWRAAPVQGDTQQAAPGTPSVSQSRHNSTPKQIVAAVSAGETGQAPQSLTGDWHGSASMDQSDPPPPLRLTPTEQAVLRAMAADPTAKSTLLAQRLGVAPATVRKSQGAVRKKFGVADGDIVGLAQERGLLSPALSVPVPEAASETARKPDPA
jgi:DNA-binding CsgD family transcriptional regulator